MNSEGNEKAPVSYPPAYTTLENNEVTVVKNEVPRDPSLNTVYMSIFTMLFCCWPCGLVGLIYGIQGMQEHYRGQFDQSVNTEKKAKKWAICGIVSGIIYVFSIIFFVLLIQAVVYGIVYTRPVDPDSQ